MFNQFSVYLEARSPEAGRFRAYSISCGKDLLGDWLVQTTFGKIGARGTAKNYAFDEFEKARKLVRALLKKRLSAHKRIGCNYEIKGCRPASQAPSAILGLGKQGVDPLRETGVTLNLLFDKLLDIDA